jgi:hypothetical protein
MRKNLVLAGIGTLGSLLVGGVCAEAATGPLPQGGAIDVAAVSHDNGPNHDVVTGAFADAGVEHQISNGLVKLVMSRGSVEINNAKLGKVIANAYNHVSITANCSAFIKARRLERVA